jgi:predicted permease
MLTGLKFAFRQLVKTPGFAVTALATLALCLGANLAIYAVVDAVLIRSLPFPESERLVAVYNSYPAAGVDRAGASISNYYDRRGAIKAFSAVAIKQDSSDIVGQSGSPRRVSAARVSPDFFSTLGVPLKMGHSFTDDQMTYKTDGVAVLTDAFWRSEFGGDPNVLGRTFLNDGLTVQVIGVLPPNFRYLSSEADFYRPLSSDPNQHDAKSRHSNGCEMLARLAPGVTVAEAQAQMDAFNLKQLTDDPYAQIVKQAGYHTVVTPLQADHVSEARPMLLLLQGGGLVLLAIGGVNLANLLLIRASGRTKELAVRQALGASPYHVARDVLTETMLLAVIGGVIGILLGAFGIRLLALLGTNHLPLGANIRFDARVGAAAFAASVLMGVLLAIPLTWFNVHTKLLTGLQSEGRSGTPSRAAQALRNFFIVAQVALAFVLLSGAGLLGLSLRHVLNTPSGFRSDNLLTGGLTLPWKTYKDGPSQLAFVEKLVPALSSIPGVTEAAVINGLPFTGNINDSAVTVEGHIPKPGESLRAHYQTGATSQYWKAMGIPLLEGRFIEDRDDHHMEKTCVVDKGFADRYWPGTSALGHRLSNGGAFDPKDCATVVGVVGNVKQSTLVENAVHGTIYFNFAAAPSGSFHFVIRSTLPAATIAPMARKAILSLDADLPVDDLKPMHERVDDTLVTRRSPAILAGIFSGVALMLSAIGTYGVLAYAVGQRRREIGVRMALGAQPEQVLRLFMGLGASLLGVGLALGILGSWMAGRAMQRVLYGVGSFDPLVVAAATGVMVVVVFFAILLPSRRAAGVNPIDALRDD